jgi:nucleotide-binding universal stress UspA family protein
MLAQVTKIERKYAMAPGTARRKLRVFIPYDGSETAEATLTGLSRAGLPNEIEALVAVTDVWLPLSPREITRTVDARRLKLLTSGLSSHVPALMDYEEQRVLSLEAERRLRTMFPAGVVKAESFQDTSAVAETILRKAKDWDAELIILGAKTSPSSQVTDYAGPALGVAQDAHRSVRIARPSAFKADAAIKIIIFVDEGSSAHNVVKAVADRNWPTGASADIVMTRKPGPRRVTRDAEAAPVLETWAHTLRAAGLKVSIAVEDGQPEQVLLQQSQQAAVDCCFIGSHHAQDEILEVSGLSEAAKTLILGAHCSVEVIRSNS